MDFLNIQDGGWLFVISLSFNISKAKHAIKNLKTDFRVIAIVLSEKPVIKYIAISLELRHNFLKLLLGSEVVGLCL